MATTPDEIAALVQKHYDALPAKRKPVIRGNGLHEWVPLAGIVAQGKNNKLSCLSLATGMKCLPTSKIPQAQGNILHDWHAEVLAIRAFNRFVLDECKILAQGGSSEFLRRREMSRPQTETEETGFQPFAWEEDIRLHMYCSEAPCGDASMELIMASQEDATPWALPPATLPSTSTISPPTPTPTLPGRAFFSQLGVVRRKPSRPDAAPTLSKSCSDKLSLHQLTSLLCSTTSLLVDPRGVYIHTLVLPSSRHSASACNRAFSAGGRMRAASGVSHAGYEFRPFELQTTTAEFAFSQRSITAALAERATVTDGEQKRAEGIATSNLALAWTSSGREEATLGGVLQGRKQSSADARGASFASRRRMWALAVDIVDLLLSDQAPTRSDEGVGMDRSAVVDNIQKALSAKTYGEVKDSMSLASRRRVKEEARSEALEGWVRNLGDESFSL
ncbi:adenosine deaminase/editase [Jackrogersella minutella]|nr:adenosine deaminase/editase [Jackrogersella minutella]